MRSIKYLLIISIAVCLFSCGSRTSYSSQQADTSFAENNLKSADTSVYTPDSSAKASENPGNSERKFIRTADLRFKVNNVASSTYKIEDIVSKEGGFITYTNLSSNVNNSSSIPVSEDSTLETTYYTVTNEITIRVPNNNLDTLLKQIAQYVDFLDSRVIKADDVSLQFLANNLAIKRLTKNSARLANDINKKATRLNDMVDAENESTNKQEQADNSVISNLSLADKVKYSTISLSLYQRQSIRHELLANEKNINSYKPSFGRQLLASFTDGWEMLEVFFVFIARFWALISLGIAVWALYKAYSRLKIKQ